MFQLGIETIYANILRLILKIWRNPIVSYSSNAIVIQFLYRNVWSTVSNAFWRSINIPQAKFLVTLWFCQLNRLALWSRRWIPNPGVQCSEPQGGSEVDSAFHPSEVGKMSTRNFWELVVKSKLPPQSGSSLETVEPHP